MPVSATCAINNKWDNGVLMMGVVEHWRKYGTASYRTYAENWADHNDWTLFSNTSGRDQENPNWNNRMTAGYTYLRLTQAGSPGATVADVVRNLDAQLALQISPEREQLVDYVFPGSTKGSLSWKFVDANFTALPVWIAMGKQTGDTRYYDRVRDLQNYQLDVMRLQDPATKLYFQNENAKTKVTANGLPVLWGRGNGWMAAGLASTLTDLPTSRAEYATYRTRFTELVHALRTRQRADGFWSMNLADPADSPGARDERDGPHHLRHGAGDQARDPRSRDLRSGRGQGLERDGRDRDRQRRPPGLLPGVGGGAVRRAIRRIRARDRPRPTSASARCFSPAPR